jgi:hypothetical protein
VTPEEGRRLHPSYDPLAEARERAARDERARMLTPSCSDCGYQRYLLRGALLCAVCDAPLPKPRSIFGRRRG